MCLLGRMCIRAVTPDRDRPLHRCVSGRPKYANDQGLQGAAEPRAQGQRRWALPSEPQTSSYLSCADVAVEWAAADVNPAREVKKFGKEDGARPQDRKPGILATTGRQFVTLHRGRALLGARYRAMRFKPMSLLSGSRLRHPGEVFERHPAGLPAESGEGHAAEVSEEFPKELFSDYLERKSL